jgi:predicted DNA-binding protein (MmcQ/YjbR family)
MATATEALKKMREICLAFPETSEGGHGGKVAFYVKGKLFATVGEEQGAYSIAFGLEPDHAEALVANDTRFKPYPRDRRAVVLDVAHVKRWSEIAKFLRESYELRNPRKPEEKPAKRARAAGSRTTQKKPTQRGQRSRS